jgi:hypothetical protein
VKLKIEIKIDNAAFTDNHGPECARILKRLAAHIEDHSHLGSFENILMDYNGNKVGVAKVTR